MDSNHNQEAWKRLTHWYRKASGRQAPQSRERLDSIATDWVELYRCRPPEGIRLLILATLAAVEDWIPGKEEVS